MELATNWKRPAAYCPQCNKLLRHPDAREGDFCSAGCVTDNWSSWPFGRTYRVTDYDVWKESEEARLKEAKKQERDETWNFFLKLYWFCISVAWFVLFVSKGIAGMHG